MGSEAKQITPYSLAILAFVLGLIGTHLLAIHSHCWEGLNPYCLIRWDSGLYLDIAQNGHTLIPCSDDPNKWCGNAGWAPLYPFLVRWLAFGIPGLSLEWSSVLVAWSGLLASFLLVAHMLKGKSIKTLLWHLAILLLAPGSIYFYAAFPLSWTLFFTLGLYYGLSKFRASWVWISAMALMWMYSIGFVFIGLLLLLYMYNWSIDEPSPLKKLSGQAFIAATLSFMALLVYEHWSTGHWNATFMVQSKYGHTLNQPLKFMGIHAERLWNNWGGIQRFIELQHFGIWIFLLLLAIQKPVFQPHSLILFSSLALLLLWALPYGSSPDVALYRNAALGAPFWMIVLNQHKSGIRWAWLLYYGICWGPMAVLFFQSILI
ncbi:MAG: hypothetical protein RL577_1346 [Bacteroidota bacterium]